VLTTSADDSVQTENLVGQTTISISTFLISIATDTVAVATILVTLMYVSMKCFFIIRSNFLLKSADYRLDECHISPFAVGVCGLFPSDYRPVAVLVGIVGGATIMMIANLDTYKFLNRQ
jgi:uncharacterized membrane protein YciS (DUF1049 family)